MIRLFARWALTSALMSFVATPAYAALPPFELVRKSLAQARAERETVEVDLQVTETGEKIREWEVSGEFAYGKRATVSGDVTIGPKARTALRLVWIALLARDPVAQISKNYGLVKSRETTVGVHQGFVYVYGTMPRIAAHRDFRRLAWFEVVDDGVRWRTNLSYSDSRLTGVLVTRNGKTVLTARSTRTRPGASSREDEE